MNISNKKGVQLIVQFLADAGIKDIVLSPGSRNAPLSLSFENYGKFKVRVIPDERVAAYHALGITMHTQTPSVICCTSGTAVLNYSPAIAEAFYQNIPMIVLTADRPEEWIDQGDGQTIRQKNVFANYIGKSYSFSGDVSDEKSLRNLNDIMNDAISFTLNSRKPVHINVSLEEPLYGMTNEANLSPEISVFSSPLEKLEEKTISDLKNIFSQAEKIMILAGQMPFDEKRNALLKNISSNKNMVVLTENTANLYAEDFISCIDRSIDGFSEEEKSAFAPDLLITIGGAVVSKKVKAWLRKNKPAQHWKIGKQDAEIDTYRCKTYSLSVNENYFLELMKKWGNKNQKYKNAWALLNEKKKTKSIEFLSETEFSDLKVFAVLLKNIPAGTFLHLGNSSPVRYAQLFDTRKDLFYFSNRGVSGIDGCTSTTAGIADASEKCVTLISGDISFFYDSNAFWNDYLKNLKVIVINNGGGGIFRIIDQPENMKDTEKLFETRHQRKAEGIAKAFGINYLSANDEKSLEISMKQLYADKLPTILEIFTPTEKNPLILKNYFTFLKNN